MNLSWYIELSFSRVSLCRLILSLFYSDTFSSYELSIDLLSLSNKVIGVIVWDIPTAYSITSTSGKCLDDN